MNLLAFARLPYTKVIHIYFRGAQAAIVVYDITNADTFARAKTWVRELQRQVNNLIKAFRTAQLWDPGGGSEIKLMACYHANIKLISC